MTAFAFIEIGRDMRAKVSAHRVEALREFNWYPQVLNEGRLVYAKCNINLVNEHGVRRRTTMFMHRFIAKAPKFMYVDHNDNDGLNNTDGNLVVCSNTYNQCNRRPTSDSGYKGVSKAKVGKPWQVTISDFSHRPRAKSIYVGKFDTAEEGARAFDRKAIEMYGPFYPINFPLSDYPDLVPDALAKVDRFDPTSDIPF